MAKQEATVPQPDPKDAEEKEKDDAILTKAIDFVFKYSKQGSECPFCGKTFIFREDLTKPNPTAMRFHLSKVHPTRCMVAYEKQDITAEIRQDDPDIDEVMQLTTQDEFDRFDMLFLDPKLKTEAEKSGDSLRWVRPDNVARWKARGAELITVKDGAEPVSGTTAADGTARANEMIAMRIPAAVAGNIRARRQSQNENGLVANKEDLNIQADAVEKAIYDAMVRDGKSTDVARQVSRARAGYLRRMGDGEMRGDWRGGNPGARRGTMVRRGS